MVIVLDVQPGGYRPGSDQCLKAPDPLVWRADVQSHEHNALVEAGENDRKKHDATSTMSQPSGRAPPAGSEKKGYLLGWPSLGGNPPLRGLGGGGAIYSAPGAGQT
jgi:hypothetical protein